MLERASRKAATMVGSADAWDLVHATLLSVCLHSGDRYDFEQFFLRSLHNGAISWLRRPGHARTCSIDYEPEPVCDIRPDDEYMRSETQRAVRKALCALGNDDQQVLYLRYFDDLGEEQIAHRLGIGYAAARKRLQRARERLQVEFLQRCQ
jgi:RNA polymerase sigma factor (sigma-70 family)